MTAAHRWTRVSGLTLVLFVLSCVTINVYFPAAEVEKVAEEIVRDVYSTGGGSPAMSPTSSRILRHWWPFGAPAAYALDVSVSTPAIRTLRGSLETRHPKLLPFYEAGTIGIDRAGFLKVREVAGLSLRQKAELKKLVKADNADRGRLYKAIVKANNLDANAVADVERIFAAKWREHARAGWWYQNDPGDWQQVTARAPSP